MIAAACDHLLNLPDIRQADDFSCGAACTMATGRYFGVGPKTLEEWKSALGTTEKNSTSPLAIIDYLRSLGLNVQAKENMSILDLAEACKAGKPVICPVQEYGIPSKQASFAYGHYVVVIGAALGHIFVQDPSMDNVLGRPGGTQGESEDPDSLQEPGRSLITAEQWDEVWHDEDADGNKYDHFGIIVGRPRPTMRGTAVRLARPRPGTAGPVSRLPKSIQGGWRKVKDKEGHEHASDTGQFTSGGGGGHSKPAGKTRKPVSKLPPKGPAASPVKKELSAPEREQAANELKKEKQKAEATGGGDPRGDKKHLPTGEKLDNARKEIDAAVKEHVAKVGAGMPVDKLYEAVAEKTGLSPEEFRAVLLDAHSGSLIRLSGWPKTVDDLSRPDLTPLVSDKVMGYAQAANKSVRHFVVEEPPKQEQPPLAKEEAKAAPQQEISPPREVKSIRTKLVERDDAGYITRIIEVEE